VLFYKLSGAAVNKEVCVLLVYIAAACECVYARSTYQGEERHYWGKGARKKEVACSRRVMQRALCADGDVSC
jgi:hypothetical protein